MKKILWVLAVVVTGALGSGLWELAIRPAIRTGGRFILTLATLGLKGPRDAIYADAARGSYERAGLTTLAMLTAVFIVGFAALWLRAFNRRKAVPLSDSRRTPSRWLAWTMPILVFVIFLLQYSRVAYTAGATNYVEVLQRAVAPYISPDDRLLYESRFAQVSTRQQYMDLVTDLNQVARANNIRVPKFIVW